MLAGKTVIVTGAASGIGAATARLVRAWGGRVIAVDRHEPADPVDSYFAADLSDRAAIDAPAGSACTSASIAARSDRSAAK